MANQTRLLDDLARVASGALGAFSGVRSDVEQRLKEQFERILGRMNLVTREEFDAVRAMAAKARATQEALEKRVAQLEAARGTSGSRGAAAARGTVKRRSTGRRAKSA